MERAMIRSAAMRRSPLLTRPTYRHVSNRSRTLPALQPSLIRQRISQRIPPASFRSSYATNPPSANPNPPHASAKVTESSYARPAHELSQDITAEERSAYAKLESHSKAAQLRTPWTRAHSDVAPAQAAAAAGSTMSAAPPMTKGKLLTTPSRMLKLIIPLAPPTATPVEEKTGKDKEEDVEPLALFVHPQQPLSYLERLIQSELPFVDEGGRHSRAPSVTFRAEDPEAHEQGPDKRMGDIGSGETPGKGGEREQQGAREEDEYMVIDGKLERTGKLNGKRKESEAGGASGKGDSNHHHLVHPDLEGRKFIRWSPSTEVGDFIRDASAGNIFLISIEGHPHPIPVAVPTFKERSHYLRMRLRKVSKRIEGMAGVKSECDRIARRGAKRVAQLGFCGLVGWWAGVYFLTFKTELGWDVMEPVTYLVGLSTLIGGYLWFLYHNREASYRAAFHVTVSKRQAALYEKMDFDQGVWDGLIEEGNRLRREIKMIADEYDVDWNEKREAGEEVQEALRKERKKEKNGGKKKGEDDGGDDD